MPWDDKSFDIWAISNWANAEWCKRCDAVIEIHEPQIYKSHPRDNGYWNWLLSNTTAKVYMLYPDYRIQMAEQYPISDVIGLITNVKTFGKEAQNFASTVDYSLALAVLHGYNQIDIYGVEMAHSSEYKSQQNSFTFWIGFCSARGIEINLHCTDGLFVKPLYGCIANHENQLDSYMVGIQQQQRETQQQLDTITGALELVKQMKNEERP